MQRNRHNGGFSLVELLVSISLFTIVLTMAVACLLVLVEANARAQNMNTVMTNLNFALDSMTREIRTGRSYYCANTSANTNLAVDAVQDCTTGSAQFLSFVEGGESITEGAGSPRIAFRYNTDSNGRGFIERRVGTGSWFPITSSNINITDMYFYVTDSTSAYDDNFIQPSVTIYLEGYSGEVASAESSFALQTTVAKRVIDI